MFLSFSACCRRKMGTVFFFRGTIHHFFFALAQAHVRACCVRFGFTCTRFVVGALFISTNKGFISTVSIHVADPVRKRPNKKKIKVGF